MGVRSGGALNPLQQGRQTKAALSAPCLGGLSEPAVPSGRLAAMA